MTFAVYDTKPYDEEYLSREAAKLGMEARFHEARLDASTASTADGCRAVCVFVNDRLDRPCLEQLQTTGVSLVALRCAGCNNVDIEAASELGIRIVRVPAYSPHAVAEHTVALLLTLNRRIHRAHNRVREHNFSLNGLVGTELHGKTVGIVGTGKIGRIAAQIFRGFDCRVLANDPHHMIEWAGVHNVSYTSLDEMLALSDIISLHLPLTPGTQHIINRAAIGRMKPGAVLVNTSRGKLVDTAAVIEALKSGHLGGVALDVYEEEEGVFFEDRSDTILQDDTLSRLLTFPNVVITSHQAFLTREALTAIANTTVESIHRHLAGMAPVADRVVV